jgi:hypothetical protein
LDETLPKYKKRRNTHPEGDREAKKSEPMSNNTISANAQTRGPKEQSRF